GVNGTCRRQRVTSVLGFFEEKIIARDRFTIPVTARSVDCVNLQDPALGLFDRLQALIDRYGVMKGRIHIALAGEERGAGRTVNEYEPLLMHQDLPDVIRDPFRFTAGRPCTLLARLRRTRTRTMTCARFLRLPRSISLLVSGYGSNGCGRLVQGRYQSPILVQWGAARRCTRDLDV